MHVFDLMQLMFVNGNVSWKVLEKRHFDVCMNPGEEMRPLDVFHWLSQ